MLNDSLHHGRTTHFSHCLLLPLSLAYERKSERGDHMREVASLPIVAGNGESMSEGFDKFF